MVSADTYLAALDNRSVMADQIARASNVHLQPISIWRYRRK